jgi:rubrerythrin
MVKLFVCGICGEPYLGDSAPPDCPFCGAPRKFIGMAEDYSTLWGVKLTEQEKADMKRTLGLEVNATAYYKDVAKTQKKYSKYERLFKQLARVETEHAEVAANFLGVKVPEFVGERSKSSIEADLKRTKELEVSAMGMYKTFLGNATNQKVKDFYTALIHAENGHAEFVSEEL